MRLLSHLGLSLLARLGRHLLEANLRLALSLLHDYSRFPGALELHLWLTLLLDCRPDLPWGQHDDSRLPTLDLDLCFLLRRHDPYLRLSLVDRDGRLRHADSYVRLRHADDNLRLRLLHGNNRRRLTHGNLRHRLAHVHLRLRLPHGDLRRGLIERDLRRLLLNDYVALILGLGLLLATLNRSHLLNGLAARLYIVSALILTRLCKAHLLRALLAHLLNTSDETVTGVLNCRCSRTRLLLLGLPLRSLGDCK